VLFAIERTARLLGLGAAVAVSALALGWTAPKDQFRRNYLAGPQADYVREGTTTSIAVVSHSSFVGSMTWRELRTPGVSMSDTRFSSRRYMGLMAHLPMFFARGHKDALLICFGVGNTARSLLSHPDLDRLDVVDISSEVLSASPYFAAVTRGDPLLDPRTHVTVDDGRHYLLTTTRSYDVITSEPPPPNHAGVVNLYSREYYRAARRVLRTGGILAQWLPVAQLSERDMLAMIAAMAAEFPYVELRYGFNYQWIILASDVAPSRDVEKWRDIAAQTSVARDLDSIGVRGEPDLAATRIQGDAMLRAASAVVAPVDDDFPSIEYPIDPVSRPPRIPQGLVGDPMRAYAGEDLFPDEVNAIETMAIVLRALPLRSVRSPELRELTLGTNLRAALRHAPGHPAIFALLDVDDIGRDAATAFLALHAGDEDALFVLARRAYYEDNFEGADARLASVHPAKVCAPCYWLLRAGCARALGRFDDAVSDLRRAVATSEDTRFQSAAEQLAQRARAPWRVDFGPLSVQNGTEATP
jgi:spermidine synthase